MHAYRDLAIKLFGLFCLLRFIAIIPGSIWSLASMVKSLYKEENFHFFGAISVSILTPLIYLLVAGLCLLKTDMIIRRLWKDATFPEDTLQIPDTKSLMETIIPLIGLYYFLFSVSHVLALAWTARNFPSGWMSEQFGYQFLPPLFQLPIALLFIIKSKSIANFIFSKQIEAQ